MTNCTPLQTRRRTQPFNGQSGYTMIEMMTVVVLVAVIAGIAITSYRGQLPQSRLRQATTELHSTLNVARIMALSQNMTMTIKISGGTSTTTGSAVTLTSPISVATVSTLSGADSQVTATTFHNDVSSVMVSPGLVDGTLQPWVRFNSMGLRAGTGAQLIVLTNTQGRVHSINVAPGGKSKWCLTSTC